MPSLWWGAPVCNTITQRGNEGWLKWRESLTTGSRCDQSEIEEREAGSSGAREAQPASDWTRVITWPEYWPVIGCRGEEREVRARHLNEAPRCEVCDTQYFTTTNSIIPLCIPHCFHFVLSSRIPRSISYTMKEYLILNWCLAHLVCWSGPNLMKPISIRTIPFPETSDILRPLALCVQGQGLLRIMKLPLILDTE